MTAQKIALYFTPDVKETGRIPINEIMFDDSEDLTRGRYRITINHPCFINGNCSSLKSDVKSTATLTFSSTAFGKKTKYIFKVNDYFEIWDQGGEYSRLGGRPGEWCYFRGVVKQTSSKNQGASRTYTLLLENAGGWMLGDNSVYYLGQLIITKEQAISNFFNPIKTKYGFLDGGKENDKYDALELTKIKTPTKLLETLVNKIGNKRVELLKNEFYDGQEAIKEIIYYSDIELASREIFIADKIAEMEGSILSILKKFEGEPFSEIFLIETTTATKILWRNSRWRDFEDNLCMKDVSGQPENLILLHDDPNAKIESRRSDYTGLDDYNEIVEYASVISEDINKSNDEVINAIFLYPAALSSNTTTPTMIVAQASYDDYDAKKILDLDSVIRHGYKPITKKLPFIPKYMEAGAFNDTKIDERVKVERENYISRGKYLSEYTAYAYSMYKNIQNSGNGANVYQNNLHCTVADDFKIIRESSEWDLFINVNKITWYFDPESPKTVLEWDRGFEKPVQSRTR